MRSEKKRWTGFKKRFRSTRINVCEVCNSEYNFRQGKPVKMYMDMAHLIARTELATFGDVGRAFNFDVENFAHLCQKCHCAFDSYCGVMHNTSARATKRFELYRERFMPLLRRRHHLLQTLISLTSEAV